jgi:hypothetical protein
MATTATSSEESTPKHLKSDNKKGAIHSLMQIKKTRPVSWHGRGRVELTIQNKPVENDNPFTKEDLEYHDEILKAFNKKYEISETAVVKLRRRTRKGDEDRLTQSILEDTKCQTTGKIRMKRVRPSSWIGVSQTPKPYEAKTEQITSPSLIGRKYEKCLFKLILIR